MELERSETKSTFALLNSNRKLDIRAEQRTYDGAYSRACIACLAFGLLIAKMFSKQFLPISIIYTIYGFSIFIITIHRSHQMQRYYDADTERLYYKTSGNIVIYLGLVSIACYTALFVLILRL